MASRAAAKFDIRAVDKSLSTIRNFNKNMNGMLKPVSNLKRGLKALSRESGLANMGRGVSKVSREIAKLTGIAGAAAGAGFFALNKMTQHADEVLKASINYGISSDAIQEWRFVAERSGVSVATMNKSMQAFTKRLAEAKNGTGELHGLLSKVNPEFLKQVTAIEDNAEAYEFMIDAMAKLPEQQRQILLGDKAFSEAGRELVKVTALGANEIARLRKESRAYGGVLSKDVLQNSAKFQDEMTNIGQMVQGVAFAIGSELIPEIKDLMVGLRNWYTLNKEVIAVDVKEFAVGAAQGIKEFAGWVKSIAPDVKNFVEKIGGLKTVAIALGAVIAGPLLLAIVGLGTAIAASPIGLFVTAVAGAVALGSELYDSWEPFRNLIDGINSIISATIKNFVALSRSVGGGIIGTLSSIFGPSGGSQRAPGATAAPVAATPQQNNVSGKIEIVIDSDGVPRDKKIKSDNSAIALNVDAGLSMAAL